MTHSTALSQNLKNFKVVRKGVCQLLRQNKVLYPPYVQGEIRFHPAKNLE